VISSSDIEAIAMNLTTSQGRTIRLPAEFFEGDERTDPANPQVDIVDPTGTPRVTGAVPMRRSLGVYFFDYRVPADAPTGTWTAIWAAVIEGQVQSGADEFEVHPAAGPAGAASAVTPLPGAATSEGGPQSVAEDREPARPVLDDVEEERRRARREERARQIEDLKAEAERLKAEKRLQEARRKADKMAARRGGEPPAPPRPGADRHPDAEDDFPGFSKDFFAEPAPAKARRARQLGRSRGVLVLLLLLAVAAVAVTAFYVTRSPLSANERSFEQAEAAIDAGRIDEASSHYRDILRRDPSNKFAFFNLGMLAQLSNRGAEARDYYSRALRSDANFLPALFNLAILEEANGNNRAAEGLYRRAIREHPDHAASRYNLGLLLIREGRTEEGQEQLDRAAEMDPGLSGATGTQTQPATPEPT
jgi:tetratricopeptide (TPR) repeat protein